MSAAPARVPQLDVLRTVAILLVMGYHPVVKWSSEAAVPAPIGLWHAVGYTGVDLFFVLSGFLVSGLLFSEHVRTGTIDVRRFLIRRIFRIWPGYYLYLAVLAVLAWRLGDLGRMLPFLVHLQNYFFDQALSPHTWSLAVEEHFYLLLPGLLWVALKRRPEAVPLAAGALLVLCALARAVQEAPVPALLTHQRIDSLGVGVALGWLRYLQPASFQVLTRRPLSLGLAGLLLVLASTFSAGMGPVTDALVATGQALGYGLVLVASLGVHGRVLQWAPVRLAAAIGAHSYAIYLWHVDFGVRLVRASLELCGLSWRDPEGWTWVAATIVYVAFSVGTGVLMSRCVDLPMLALRDRWFPPKSVPTP